MDTATWFTAIPYFALTLTLLFAILLDNVLGEAKKYHYLVGFGWLCGWLEKRLNPEYDAKTSTILPDSFSIKSAILGGVAWTLLVLPLPIIYFFLFNDLAWYWQVLVDSVILYLAIGLNSLKAHAMQVYAPLKSGDVETARHFTGYLVSRDTQSLSPDEMSRATVESMLENGHDSVIASIIYYLIGGASLVILHRLANTLDAMWGYKNSRFYSFGYVSARFDDLLGFFTGKCCSLLYALQGNVIESIKNAYLQGNQYKSHNGGWVMAAGATVMNIRLGGLANYHGALVKSVTLGNGKAIAIDDIPRSITLVQRATALLLLFVFCSQIYFFNMSLLTGR
ncbi:cobalamin biosynthesis protein CobD/CbiB [Thalassotalea profundi]|nr:CobD/CbiB family cobalamin biosynthesis protein [Thalassotalea profundi]